MKHSNCCGTHYFKDHGFVQHQWELHIGVLLGNSRSSGPSRNSSIFCSTYAQNIAVVQVLNKNTTYLLSLGIGLQPVTKVLARLPISLPPSPHIYDKSQKGLVTRYSVKL